MNRGPRRTPSSAWAPPVYDLSGLANTLTVMFSITSALLAIRIASPTTIAPAYSYGGIYLKVNGITALLEGLLMLATIVVFLNWFYRARMNAGLTTWRQRWSPGWTI